MIRTAIFGGSFNPIHNGHLQLAAEVLRQHLADNVWFMVSPQNPFKQQEQLLDEQIRLAMARMAVADMEGVEASDFEFSLPRPSYTWRTLELLAEQFPAREFLLLIGADNWLAFDKWAKYDEILHKYSIIVYPREGFETDAQSLPPTVRLLHARLYPYSSTDIRKVLKSGNDCEYMLPPNVWTFIKENKLYI